MDLVIVGAGRAGGALAIAARSAGHTIAGVVTRRPTQLGPAHAWDSPLPPADLVIVAVSDDAIADVAHRLAPVWHDAVPAVHVSGFVPVASLEAIASLGAPTGSLHPLQTLPDPNAGASALTGAWSAVTTAHADLASLLDQFAISLGMRPFRLADDVKGLYHAAAAAGANYVVEVLAVAADLLDAAGVRPEVLEPLTRQVVDNVFALGAGAALTGPVARGDLATVAGQMKAAASVSPALGRQFEWLTRATADRVGLEL